jgi:hypothetical protein
LSRPEDEPPESQGETTKTQGETMSPPTPADGVKRGASFKERAWREARTLLFVLATSVCFDLATNLFSADSVQRLREFNERVVESVKDIGPLDMARAFDGRRRASRYGWRLFSFKEPFNVTAAHERLRAEWQQGRIPREEYERRAANVEYYALTSDPRMSRVTFGKDGRVEFPKDESAWKGLSAVVGIPDALIYSFRAAFSRGWASVLAYTAAFVLAFALVLTRDVTNVLVVLLWTVLLASVIAYLILLPVMWAAKLALWFLNMPQTVAVLTILGYPLVSFAGQVGGKVGEHYFQERLMRLVRREK